MSGALADPFAGLSQAAPIPQALPQGLFGRVAQQIGWTPPSPSTSALLKPYLTPMPQTLTAPKPSLSDHIQNGVAAALQTLLGFDERHAQNFGGKVMGFLNDATPVGPIVNGYNAGQDLGNGNLKGGLGNLVLAAFGAIPEAGGLVGKTSRAPLVHNYLVDLAEHAPTLFRETSPDLAQRFIPHSNTYAEPGEVFLADTPDLALGQGSNKGVMLQFDSNGLRGQVSTAKPSWPYEWENGRAEYVGKYNPQGAYQNNLQSLTIKPDAQVTGPLKERLGRTLRVLQQQHGWQKTVGDDGSLTLTRPSGQ